MMATASFPTRLPSRQGVHAPWGWAGAGAVFGLLLALLLFLPARWLALGVQQASAGQVQLHAARGTLWNGSAHLMLTGGTGSPAAAALPGRVQWGLRPTWLGGVGLALQWRADCCLQQPWRWTLVPHWAGLQLAASDSRSQWPAQLLAGLGTPWNTIAAQGQLELSTRALVLGWSAGRLQVTGSAQLDALEVSSRLSTLRPMGSYRLTVQGGNVPALSLSTLAGDLRLSGQGQWVGGRLRFAGEASAAAQSQEVLANLLAIIGRRQGGRSIIKIG